MSRSAANPNVAGRSRTGVAAGYQTAAVWKPGEPGAGVVRGIHRRRWARSGAGYRPADVRGLRKSVAPGGTVQRRAGDSTAQASSTLLNVSGRALIDTANGRLRVVDGEGDLPFEEAVLDALSPDQFRYYEFLDDQLRLTVQDENGRTTSTTIWRSSPCHRQERHPADTGRSAGNCSPGDRPQGAADRRSQHNLCPVPAESEACFGGRPKVAHSASLANRPRAGP